MKSPTALVTVDAGERDLVSQAGPGVAESKGREASPPESVGLIEASPAAAAATVSKSKRRNQRRSNQRRAAAATKAAAMNDGEKLALCVAMLSAVACSTCALHLLTARAYKSI